MDDCFTESLVYSASDDSETEEPAVSLEDHLEQIEKTTEDLPTQNNESEESDDDLNKSVVKSKKSAKILSSDDDDENDDGGKVVNDDDSEDKEEKNVSDDDKEDKNSDNDSHMDVDAEPSSEKKSTSRIRPTICDSDTKSSSDENKITEIPKQIMRKKLKKKKEKPKQSKKSKQVQSESDSDDSSSTKGKHKEKHTRNSSGSNTSSSGESSNSDSSNHSNDEAKTTKLIKPREKPAQRMSAKMAKEQMKEIQSESQRLAREAYVSVPYHKPKQHTLKEFLSRPSFIQQQEKLKSKPVQKAAVAIKMSEEELIQYMNDLEKRTKEAEEFFQDVGEEESKAYCTDDSDESDKETDAPKVSEEKPTDESNAVIPDNCEENAPASPPKEDELLEKPIEIAPSDIIDDDMHLVSDQVTSNLDQPSESTEVIEPPPPVRTQLDDELDGMEPVVEKIPKLSIATDYVPKLQGDKGFVIDFETNDLKPAPKSGVDELLSRFLKNAVVKTQETESQDFGIFHTDTGTVERHNVLLTLNDKVKKEPRPGESLIKLRHELEMKIRENRQKIIAQRLQEVKEQELKEKQMEMENEEFEELSNCGDSGAESEGQVDALNEEMSEHNDAEQNGDENIESNDDDGDGDDDESGSESETETLDLVIPDDAQKARKRIVTMDDDSDEDSPKSPAKSAPNDEISADAPNDESETQLTGNLLANASVEDATDTMNNQDLSALESEILQLNNSSTETEPTKTQQRDNTTLFMDGSGDNEEIGESQLMALCSGTFATQFLDNQPASNGTSTQINGIPDVRAQISKTATNDDETKEDYPSKPAFLSSDEEEVEKTVEKRKKKKKKQTLVYSDNEDEDENDQHKATPESMDENSNSSVDNEQGNAEEEEEVEGEGEEDEEDPGEKYIEYDSDENEIQVELKKTDIRKKASEFFENEAELSESEWGSEDEDEKDMNRYEAELGDADKFDKNKLRGELERIRLREQIDDDARELRILTERFIEEEDNGQERERKFRWKHLNNGDLNDDQVAGADQDASMQQNSDDENEAEWRRIRYEREQLLKQQRNEADSVVERTSVVLDSTELTTAGSITAISSSTKRLSIIKPVSSKTSSPFLITKTDLNMGHLSRKSFLNRDSPTLEKLASLTKSGNDNDVILNKAKGKGNYVFVATEKKDNSKRKSESEVGDSDIGANNPSKKSKLDLQKNTKIRPQTKVFFESLN